MLSTLSNAAKKRILIKGGKKLEDMIGIKAVVFDKTGTITSGIPKVNDIVISDDQDHDYILRLLYTVEKQSNHPLAKSVAKHLEDLEELDDVQTKEIPGGMFASKMMIGKSENLMLKLTKNVSLKINQAMSKGHSIIYIIKKIIKWLAL